MLEDMMRARVIDFGGSWDSYFHLVVFSYNNNYHSSIGAPSYKLLYRNNFRTLVCWGEFDHNGIGRNEVVL